MPFYSLPSSIYAAIVAKERSWHKNRSMKRKERYRKTRIRKRKRGSEKKIHLFLQKSLNPHQRGFSETTLEIRTYKRIITLWFSCCLRIANVYYLICAQNNRCTLYYSKINKNIHRFLNQRIRSIVTHTNFRITKNKIYLLNFLWEILLRF